MSIARNTAIGYQAGLRVNSGANNNTFIGWRAGDDVTTASFCIFIGDDINGDDNTTDYQLNIGNALKGDLQNGNLYVTGQTFRIATSKTPSSATDTGTAGQIAWDANYIYICIATNTWRRVAHSTW